MGNTGPMRVTAKVDYAVRAAIVLAAAYEAGLPTKGERIASAQQIPAKYLENILSELRQSSIVRSQRGAEGGYWLQRPPDEVSIADIIRAVEGPLANVRGEPPELLEYPEGTGALLEAWVATRSALRGVLEKITLADLSGDGLPKQFRPLLEEPGAWLVR